ncbi:MAG: hypothetical protein HXX11_19410 [Desulfuromonadales bacterium]|nr:hypothetical protein [Desulfuromonadales bacterium]
MKRSIKPMAFFEYFLLVAFTASGSRLTGSGRQASRTRFVAAMICGMLLAITCASTVLADREGGEQVPAPVVQLSPANPPVAVVNGQPIKAAELDTHAAATQLSPEYALEDLIDLMLVRAAATEKGVSAPARAWNADERAAVEATLAKALSLDVAAPRVLLVVDHAWLKDAEDEQERVDGRARMERLRAMVAAGATIPDAFARLQLDGTLWHIGDHEEYPADVIPPEARDLPPASLSGIISGDGGLHLFRIHQRKQILPTSDEIRGPLRDRLRRDAVIERIEPSEP